MNAHVKPSMSQSIGNAYSGSAIGGSYNQSH